MSKDPACEVCSGSGEYPIINNRGRELYSIRCPECYGGEGEGAAAPDSSTIPHDGETP